MSASCGHNEYYKNKHNKPYTFVSLLSHMSYHHVLLTMETVRIVLPKLVFSTTSQVINTGVKQICH